MARGLRYRVVSVTSTAFVAAAAVLVANAEPVQAFVTTTVPVLDRLSPSVMTGRKLRLALAITVVAVTSAMAPLFRPKPRRILDIVFRTESRVVVAALALATVGYFDLSSRLPRPTLIVVTVLLLIGLPPVYVYIRTAKGGVGGRTIVLGDDPTEIRKVVDALDTDVLGYVAPPTRSGSPGAPGVEGAPIVSDGGLELELLGGLSRLESIIVDNDVDTVVFAFAETDRAEFFGALGTCQGLGVDVKIHRDKADGLLVSADPGQRVVDVDIEPWDPQDRLFKRLFDVAFAATGLLVLSPLVVVIAGLVKLDTPGPVIYSQARTAELGETFPVYKFRTMVPEAEADTGPTISNEDEGRPDPRVTRVGRFLRRTHLDEIPQLWSVLVGDMSVVGPRPERPELESDIETGVVQWRRRWFVKPGLTGLAQINGVTGHQPAEKLRYDVEYIRRQSLHFDVAIVIRQLWQVLTDAKGFIVGGGTP